MSRIRPGRLAVFLLAAGAALPGRTARGDGGDGGAAAGTTTPTGNAAELAGVTVTGPTANGERPNPFSLPVFDLDGYGYSAREYFFGGDAVSYAPAPGTQLGTDGRWALQPSGTAPFRSRMLVLRPSDPKKFSGTVWLSWLNVTAGFEIGDFTRASVREGDATVYVSAQKIGLDGVPGAEGNGLRRWDPKRYGSLAHPGDDFSYGIFTKAALLVGHDRGKLPVDPMAGFDVKHVFATGASQSAIRLTSYLDGVQPLSNALDGALLIANFGRAARVDTGSDTDDADTLLTRPPVRIRDDLDIPVILVSTETEAESIYPVRQPDSATFRYWEIAGAAHAGAGADSIGDVVTLFVRDGLKLPSGDLGSTSGAVGATSAPNSLDWLPVISTARVGLTEWASGNTPPPVLPRISLGENPPRIERDEYGNALGGIRMPELEVPVATYSGVVPGASAMESLFGSMSNFSPDRLHSLYPDGQAYLTAYNHAVDEAVSAGYLLAQDADSIRAAAATNAAKLFPTS
ncbi:alpha/beta hydrolase domain-containing protein [Pseudofrankia saprophytica]|uniref:alpha/beta hydrolase domain-containing protein n=1 Tax=Pseudofrankia saprophytica TaxID=298655 RepID=UPI000234B9CB|nr:alpha/beta hydrolase domain-containing protein [Pseudofrankia saprophytica]